MKIVVAGASGYVGQALVERLLSEHADVEIIALSRTSHESKDPRVSWKACDLFSLKSLEQTVPDDIDIAYYLVHSMGPTARLDQGSFADYDLLLADNFIRRLKTTTFKRLIYLGGLVAHQAKLSLHLQSRLEVEETFRQSNRPVTVFRAGLIIGEHGSSFQILSKLVNRLPLMICPRWTQTLTTPVDLKTVVGALVGAAQDRSNQQKTFDLAACEPLSYVEMMRVTARAMKKRRLFLTVPLFTPTLSRLWVRLITGAPKELVYPLVESLEHKMVARADHLYKAVSAGTTYASLIQSINFEIADHEKAKKGVPFRAQRKTVRSVQRLPLPHGRDARWVTEQYMRWLPKFLAPMVKVTTQGPRVSFCFVNSRLEVLKLHRNEERSSTDRQLLYVEGGALSASDHQGRLEFREVLGGQFVLAAIHEFKPSLPWAVYRLTQAIAHVWVMRNFGRHLGRQSIEAVYA